MNFRLSAAVVFPVIVFTLMGLIAGYKLGYGRGESDTEERRRAFSFPATVVSLSPATNGGCLRAAPGVDVQRISGSAELCGLLWWAGEGEQETGAVVTAVSIRNRTADGQDVSGFLLTISG